MFVMSGLSSTTIMQYMIALQEAYRTQKQSPAVTHGSRSGMEFPMASTDDRESENPARFVSGMLSERAVSCNYNFGIEAVSPYSDTTETFTLAMTRSEEHTSELQSQ